MKVKYILIIIIVFIAGFFVGKRGSSDEHEGHKHKEVQSVKTDQEWICSMHPQIRSKEEGDCPICGMALIPADGAQNALDPYTISLDEASVKLAGIETRKVQKQTASYDIQLNGQLKYDETKNYSQTSHFSGRTEKLYVSYDGESVAKGKKIARIYSPELIRMQKELFDAKDNLPANLYKATQKRFSFFKISEKQLDLIIKEGKIIEYFDIYADYNGIITKMIKKEGDYIKKGEILYKLSSINKVWADLEAFENDLKLIKTGNRTEISIDALNKKLKGKISYIDPFIDPVKRFARVRVELENNDNNLKPNLFVKARIKGTSNKNVFIIPSTSVMWTGNESIVYIKSKEGYSLNKVTIYARSGNFYLINKGLKEGDEVVVNGTFTLDAAAQLSGKYSMMNRPALEKYSRLPDYKIYSDKNFTESLNRLLESYLELKDFLVQSNYKDAVKLSGSLLNNINKIKSIPSGMDAEDWWNFQKNSLKQSLKMLQSAKDLETNRKEFETLSDLLIETFIVFGNADKLYVQYCPMAFNDKGAHWISREEEILNPYFGDKMLRCGEVKQIIE